MIRNNFYLVIITFLLASCTTKLEIEEKDGSEDSGEVTGEDGGFDIDIGEVEAANEVEDTIVEYTDEGPDVIEDEWVCHNATFSDLSLTCTEACSEDDSDFICDTAYTGSADCSDGCLYLRSYGESAEWESGYCGYLRISREFIVRSGSPLLNFSFKSTGFHEAAGSRGVSSEIEGRPETYTVIVEHRGDDDIPWMPHSVDLSGFEGETAKIIFYMKDLSSSGCENSWHRISAYMRIHP